MDENIDLIKFKLKTVDEEGNIIEKLEGPTFEKCTGEEGFEKLCGYDQYIDPACIYLYRKEFWVNNKFKYELGAYHEDFGLTPFVIINAKTFVSTEQYGYNYLQTNNSITRGNDRKKNIKKAKDVLKHYDIMIKNVELSINLQKYKGEANNGKKDYKFSVVCCSSGSGSGDYPVCGQGGYRNDSLQFCVPGDYGRYLYCRTVLWYVPHE